MCVIDRYCSVGFRVKSAVTANLLMSDMTQSTYHTKCHKQSVNDSKRLTYMVNSINLIGHNTELSFVRFQQVVSPM